MRQYLHDCFSTKAVVTVVHVLESLALCYSGVCTCKRLVMCRKVCCISRLKSPRHQRTTTSTSAQVMFTATLDRLSVSIKAASKLQATGRFAPKVASRTQSESGIGQLRCFKQSDPMQNMAIYLASQEEDPTYLLSLYPEKQKLLKKQLARLFSPLQRMPPAVPSPLVLANASSRKELPAWPESGVANLWRTNPPREGGIN